MRLVRCEKGHFYDQDRFITCSHCAGALGNNGGTKNLKENLHI